MDYTAIKSLVTVIVPTYNEEEYVGALLTRVLRAELPPNCETEIIVVDDGSTDDTAKVVAELCDAHPARIRVLRNETRRGKGYSVRRALDLAQGRFTIIQDADLEYNPNEYRELSERASSSV